jgi:hypothetical protein
MLVPEPAHGEVLVKVKAASINPGEAAIRQGRLHAMWPATFPSGEGSDFAGTVAKVGSEVAEFLPGDEVCGFTDRRASHAEYVVAEAQNLTRKPANVSWEVAGSGAAYPTILVMSNSKWLWPLLLLIPIGVFGRERRVAATFAIVALIVVLISCGGGGSGSGGTPTAPSSQTVNVSVGASAAFTSSDSNNQKILGPIVLTVN